MTAPRGGTVTAALAGRYTVERELGRGGMATVYLALDPKHGRKVAIKVLQPELAASLGAERFLREIAIAARLTHPHILPLIDSGEAEGFLYYVMPYVPDGSLRERLRPEAPLAVPEAIRIARDIGAALDYAHREGFVHRDVKPENILFADGHAVLADFGIARARSAVTPGVITEVGLALGTPEYMSPEQAAGESALDAASDLYSLGCVVYEMLTGAPPLQGDGPRATMAKQVTGHPLPIRTRRPEVPGALDRALTRALAKNPRDRFATAAEFVTALRAQDAPGPAPPRGAGYCIAVLPFANASGDPGNEYLSDGITDELINALTRVEGLRVASRTSVYALKGKPQDVRAIGALLGAAWLLEGSVRRADDRLRVTAQLTDTEGGSLLWSHAYDRTLADVFAIQEELARTIVDTLRVTSFAHLAEPVAKRYTESIAAYGYYLRGRYAWNMRTQEGVAEAIRCFEQAIAEDPRYAPAYAGLADSYALQLDYRSVAVDEGFRRAKEYARRALALDDTVAEAHASLAWSLFIHDWDWAGAEREFRRAIALDPHYATAHQWYSFWLVSHGRFDEALREGHLALEADPASISIRRTVGYAYFYARRFEEAVDHLTRTIAMNPNAEESYRVLGLVLSHAGDAAEAERAARESVSLPGAGVYSRATLGYVLARAGKRDEAAALLADIDDLARREYVSPVALATLHIGLGHIAQALDWSERAFAERRGWPVYFKVNPVLDPLRGEARFQAMVGRLGL